MNALNPRIEIKIGKLRFSEHGLLPLVGRVDFNRNIDKTASRGKRKSKMNHARVTMNNHDGQANKLLRQGTLVTISAGYADTPLFRWGTFQIEEAARSKKENGARDWNLTCLSREAKTAYDKEAAQHLGLTASEVAQRYATKHGMKTRIVPTRVKISVTKSARESAAEYLEQLAYDHGYEFYIDDTDEQEVLVFAPAQERPIIINGQRLTIGHGPEGVQAGAMLLAKTLEFRTRFPRTVAGLSRKRKSGDSVDTWAQALHDSRQYLAPEGGKALGQTTIHELQPTDYAPRAEYFAVSKGTEPEGSSLESAKVASVASHAAIKHIMTASFCPGWPLVQIANSADIVGEDDDNGTYRFVGITQVWMPASSETILNGTRGLLGGSKKGVRSGQGVRVFSDVLRKMGLNPTAFIEELQKPAVKK